VALAVAPFIAAASLAATSIQIDKVQAGLEVAIARKVIPADGALQAGVTQFLQLLQEGTSPEDASSKTGVKLAVISRLEDWGSERVAQSRSATPLAKKAVEPIVPVVKEEADRPQVAPPALSKKIAVVFPASSAPALASPRQIANTLVRGLTVANRTGEIGYNSTLRYQVQNLVRSLRRGTPLAKATKVAPVPEKTVQRLIQLGN
jgi:hypothetical protein